MSELKAYTEEELAEHQHLYDEVFTPVWESEGQYCRAGGGQYEKSFAWWAFKHQQSKVDELQNNINLLTEALDIKEQLNQKLREREDELQKRVDAVKQLIQEYRDPPTEDKTFRHALSIVAYDLEQALKGGESCQ